MNTVFGVIAHEYTVEVFFAEFAKRSTAKMTDAHKPGYTPTTKISDPYRMCW